MRKSIRCLNVTLVAVSLSGCASRPGIEGTVRLIVGGAPMKGVEIVADARTNVKEQQAAAHKTATTDTQGQYSLTGLLPETTYEVRAAGGRYSSATTSILTPKTGTAMAAPLEAYPVPGGDVVVLSPPDYLPKRLGAMGRQLSASDFTTHEKLLKSMSTYSYASFTSLDPGAARSAAIQVPEQSLLIFTFEAVPEIAKFFQTNGWTHRGLVFPPGYYVGFGRFDPDPNPYTNTMVGSLSSCTPGELGNGVMLLQPDPGLYCVTTRRQQSGSPSSGYVVWVGGAEPTEVVVQGADASPQALAAASRSLIGKWDVWDGRMTLTFHDDGTFHFVNFQPPHQQAIDVLDGKWKVHGKSLTARATSGWEGTFEIENITPTAFSLRQMAWTYTGKKIQ